MRHKRLVALAVSMLLLVSSYSFVSAAQFATVNAGKYGLLNGAIRKPDGANIFADTSVSNPSSEAVLYITLEPVNIYPESKAGKQFWKSYPGAGSITGYYTNYRPILDAFKLYGAHEVRGAQGYVAYTASSSY
ncbi:MAG: hypothetical protein Q4P72_05760 [Eubacteriales bacterium]|nr:hypothetical protein [Eubacteriales bacterium]